MKKALLLVAVLALALGITYLLLHKTDSANNQAPDKDPALMVGSKTSAFNRSIAGLLGSYYELSDAFFSNDTARISGSAKKLNTAVDSIRFDQFKADSSLKLTAITVTQSIPSEIAGLLGEKTMEQKKIFRHRYPFHHLTNWILIMWNWFRVQLLHYTVRTHSTEYY